MELILSSWKILFHNFLSNSVCSFRMNFCENFWNFRLGIFEWLGMVKYYLILVSNQFVLRNLVTRSEVNESRVLLRL